MTRGDDELPPRAVADDGDIPGVTRRHRLSDLYHERTNFQFIKHTTRWLILSSVARARRASRALFITGLNFGIEFKGGTSWQVTMADGKNARHVTDVRDVLGPLGFADAKVSDARGTNGQSVNVQDEVVADPIQTIQNTLADDGTVLDPADVQFERNEDGGGTFTFTVDQGRRRRRRKPSEGDDATTTELATPNVTVDGQNVTVTRDDAARRARPRRSPSRSRSTRARRERRRASRPSAPRGATR